MSSHSISFSIHSLCDAFPVSQTPSSSYTDLSLFLMIFHISLLLFNAPDAAPGPTLTFSLPDYAKSLLKDLCAFTLTPADRSSRLVMRQSV